MCNFTYILCVSVHKYQYSFSISDLKLQKPPADSADVSQVWSSSTFVFTSYIWSQCAGERTQGQARIGAGRLIKCLLTLPPPACLQSVCLSVSASVPAESSGLLIIEHVPGREMEGRVEGEKKEVFSKCLSPSSIGLPPSVFFCAASGA